MVFRENVNKEGILTFLIVLGDYFILMKKVEMYYKKRTMVALRNYASQRPVQI